jgi:uncharacterized membrane protein
MTISNHHHRSHHLVKSFEAQALKKRPLIVKLADAMTSSFGTLVFLLLNVIFFLGWILINAGKTPFTPFDPFPFLLLSVAVSSYAIILSIIVLISQNRESQINSLRQELQLQVNLIAEREITKVLKVLKEIREEVRKGKITDEELDEMIKEVDTSYLERRLEEQIKESESPLSPLEKLLKK